MRKNPNIMLVVPCYNEEEVLESTASVLLEKIQILQDRHQVDKSSCIVFVDDGSSDKTWENISLLHDRYSSKIHGIKLAHNKGHQNALFAGLMYALDAGVDACISLDADLQDDPNAIDEMIERYTEGDEIVYGVRDNRERDTFFKRTSAHAFYSLMKKLGAETVPDHADYRLLSRTTLIALSQYGESNLFLRGIVPSLGFKTSKVYYSRGVRIAGESKYPLRKMIAFAIDGITSFSTKPLSLISAAGILSVVVSVIMLIYTVLSVFLGSAVAGWGSIMSSLWFLGGCILLAIGVVGEYVGKIYIEVKDRPRYIVEATL